MIIFSFFSFVDVIGTLRERVEGGKEKSFENIPFPVVRFCYMFNDSRKHKQTGKRIGNRLKKNHFFYNTDGGIFNQDDMIFQMKKKTMPLICKFFMLKVL